jgi:polyisoprenoid-binding protein YceI
MKRSLAIAALLAAAAAPAYAKPTTWQIDPAHSAAEFVVLHLGIANVRGQFTKLSGTVTWDPENPTASMVEATVDVNTVDTREEKRDQHLKSPDFFDVAKFPTLTFKSKKVTKKGKQLEVTGDLTMHGVTKEVTFLVEPPSKQVKDPWGNTRSAATGITKVNRTDYGLKWNKAIEGGGVLVAEDVAIGISLELIQAK